MTIRNPLRDIWEVAPLSLSRLDHSALCITFGGPAGHAGDQRWGGGRDVDEGTEPFLVRLGSPA